LTMPSLSEPDAATAATVARLGLSAFCRSEGLVSWVGR
jgi:hypothetical protein